MGCLADAEHRGVLIHPADHAMIEMGLNLNPAEPISMPIDSVRHGTLDI